MSQRVWHGQERQRARRQYRILLNPWLAVQADAASFTYAQVFSNLQACQAAPPAPAPAPAPAPGPAPSSGPSCFGFVRQQCCSGSAPQQCVCGLAGNFCSYVKVRNGREGASAWWHAAAYMQLLPSASGEHRATARWHHKADALSCAPAPHRPQASSSPLSYGVRGLNGQALPGSVCFC